MKMIEVVSPRQIKEFLLLQPRLYKNESNYIRPLDRDIESVFNPKKNKSFEHGECIRWILQNNQEETIGRVAAFVNYKTASLNNSQPTGGMGFFECVNNKQAAFLLFDACKTWLQTKGMEAMDGPINFGNRSAWWGLLVDGFDIPPIYSMNYHFSYYKNLFETYGFQVYFNQLTFGRKTLKDFNQKIYKKAKMLEGDKRYVFRHMEINKIKRYAEDFRTVYNAAWAKHSGVAQMSKVQAEALLKQFKPIIDPKIIWFGYFQEKPIAIFISLPDINQIFKRLNGQLNLWAKLKFLYYKQTIKVNKMFGMVFGVVPEFQGKGVDGAIVLAAAQLVQKDYYRYERVEMNWIGDFNPKMILVARQVGGRVVKTHATYRKLFDESKPFERMQRIE